MELDAVLTPGKVATFLPKTFSDLEMVEWRPSENTILLVEEEDENSPSTTSLTERPTQPPRLLRSCFLEAGLEGAGICLKDFV